MPLVSKNFDFFKNCLSLRVERSAIGFGMPWTPKYVPLKPFQCIFPSQNQQNVKVLPEFFIFHEPLIIETQNLYHWIWHITNPKYMPLKSFWCIFPSQNLQNVKFMPVYWTPPNTKWKKILIWTGKKCSKWLENLHRQVFRYANHNALYQQLCVTSTFSVMRVFLNFWQEGLGIGFWNMVYG